LYGSAKLYLFLKINPSKKKKNLSARHQWLMPVILAAQEAEMRKITAQSRHGLIVPEILSQEKSHHKKGLAEWLKM
jgi:hypothetical protein